MKDKRKSLKKLLAFLGLAFGFFAAMALVMFFTVRPLGNYLMASDIPRWVLYCVMLSTLMIIPPIFALTFNRIAKKHSIFPYSEGPGKEDVQNDR